MVDSRFIKSISQRFDIETARYPNKLRRLRWRVTCTCALLTLLIIIANLAVSGDAVFQSRPVTFSHASLAADCKQCHDASFQLPRRLLGNTDALFIHSCEQCHEQRLADHHGKPSDLSNITDCASCHSEHRGQTSLTNVSDSQCVTCHSDINVNTDHHQSAFSNTINSIDTHPEIVLLKQWINSRPATTHGVHQVATLDGNQNEHFTDGSNIKFNHAVHLRENGVLVPPDHPDYGRPAGNGSSTTTLDCANCHTPDAIGQGMQPIKYEQHCASCHQLSYTSLLAKTPLANNKPLPHVSPELINGILRDRLINYRKSQNIPASGDPNQIDVFGATRNPAKIPLSENKQSDWDWVESHLPSMQALLFTGGKTAGQGDLQNGCALCHTFDSHQIAKPNESIINWHIRPSNIPDKWLVHSKFPHDRHAQTSCVKCHYTISQQNDGLVSARQSVNSSDILIPSIKTCQSCHTDERAKTPAIARGRCVHCHDYHNDHVSQNKFSRGEP
ncbi:MAG: cytochrome c3 family protein [Planctomycetaceae bacterium]|jgi:hypothetical protein|nr:cytochrome c3 family protein [Planctomycetaceae bacterium]